MDKSLYISMTGASQNAMAQRAHANNLANLTTTGFRRDFEQARSMPVFGDGYATRAYAMTERPGTDMSAGVMQETGRELDVAVQGEGWIAVQAADGTEAYTRRGDLSVSATGLLVNGDGRTVMGENGPITIPPGANPEISPDGTISVANLAAPDAPPAEVGRIKLATWQGSPIAKGLDGLFRVEGGGILPTDQEATVQVGALEQSNVKSTEILVDMIDAQRLFAMRSKLLSTAKDLDQSGAQLMRLG